MKLLTTLCVALLLTASAVCQGQTVSANLPDGVVVLVEAANLVDAWQGLQEMATAISPNAKLPPPAAVPGGLLNTQDPSTVDLARPIQAAMLGSAAVDPSAAVLVFHVTDVQAYLSSLGPGMEKVRDEGGLAVYSRGPSEIGIGSAGKRVVMGRGPSGLKAAAEALAMLKAGRWPEEAIGGEDDLAVAVRPAALLKGLSAQGQDPFATMKAALQGQMQKQGTQPMGPMADLLGAEIDVLQDVLQQLDTVVLTASFGADEVMLKNQVRFVSGGSIAAYLAGLPSGKLQLQRYVPADAMGAVVGKVGDAAALLKGYDAFLRKMAQALGADQPRAEAMVQFTGKMAALMGHELAEAVVVSPDGAMCQVYAVETTDPPAMQALVASAPALFADLSSNVPGMPKLEMSASPEPIIYKEHRITEWNYSIEFHAVPGMPNADEVAAMQKRMIDLMYGGATKAYGTFLNKTWLLTYGAGALEQMKALIDGAGTPEGLKRLDAALAGMPGEPDVVGYLSLTDAAAWYMRVLSVALAQSPLPIDLKAVTFSKAPDAGFSARMVGKDLAEAQVRVPTAAIKALVDGMMAVYRQAAASQAGAANGGGPGQPE